MPNWYRNIHELPLKHFETCIVDGNLAALVISGFPSPSDLEKSFANIMGEYSDYIGNGEYKIYVKTYKQIVDLNITHEQILFLISTLKSMVLLTSEGIVLNEEQLSICRIFASELNSLLKINFKLNPNNSEECGKELDRCERRNKANKIHLDLKNLEFESLQKKFGDNKGKHDKNYFNSMLIILSKHNGYSINKEKTVAEYCEFVKQFNIFFDKQSNKK